MARPAVVGQRPLEPWHHRALGQEIRAQHRDYRGDVGIGYVLTSIGNHLFASKHPSR